jgi:hypothetical protein
MLSQPTGKAMGRPVRAPARLRRAALWLERGSRATLGPCMPLLTWHFCRQGANVASDDIVAKRFMQAERRRAQRR